MASNAVCVHGASRRHHPQNACLTTNTLPPRSPMCFRFARTSTHVPAVAIARSAGRTRVCSAAPRHEGAGRRRRRDRAVVECGHVQCDPHASRRLVRVVLPPQTPEQPMVGTPCVKRRHCDPRLRPPVEDANGAGTLANAWRRFRMLPAQGMCAARPGRFSVGVRGVGRAVCGSGYSAVGLHVRRRL